MHSSGARLLHAAWLLFGGVLAAVLLLVAATIFKLRKHDLRATEPARAGAVNLPAAEVGPERERPSADAKVTSNEPVASGDAVDRILDSTRKPSPDDTLLPTSKLPPPPPKPRQIAPPDRPAAPAPPTLAPPRNVPPKSIDNPASDPAAGKQPRPPLTAPPKPAGSFALPSRLVVDPATGQVIKRLPPLPPIAELPFDKRIEAGEHELRYQLLAVPELTLIADSKVQGVREVERTATTPEPFIANNLKLAKEFRQAGLQAGLPLQSGPQCRLEARAAAVVRTVSTELRKEGFVSIPGGTTTGRRIAQISIGDGWIQTINKPTPRETIDRFQKWCDQNKVEKARGGLATLLQMLQIEDLPIRLLLVRELAKIDTAESTTALAKRAVADLAPEVRQVAVAALQKRSAAQYLPILLQALHHPWVPVADHAALALKTLKPEGALPKLVALLDQPDPSVPVLDKKTKRGTVPELVRLNHLRHCLLCHPPSTGPKDGLVRGFIPVPGVSLGNRYYAQPDPNLDPTAIGNIARADIIFLRQDFSVSLPVKDAGQWPSEQRFDFVARVRTLQPDEMAKIPVAPPGKYPQREAVLYALRNITGKDGGESSARWRELLELTDEKNRSP
ncbi:MAG TPA: HEAT repeat domain-containing protein [Gemmataceae bacterium]|jgi:hypothetical protein